MTWSLKSRASSSGTRRQPLQLPPLPRRRAARVLAAAAVALALAAVLQLPRVQCLAAAAA